ncbi:MAG: 16S rRNA (adenine(1518)-N(6)/adenine(1519)-N(6))-dimethyltransferase RsmA [Candidatus Hermodarchaeota archaeon]
MNKKETQLILNELGVRPNKKLGQNFLIDKSIISKVILESRVLEDDVILEIGPGLGALTEELVRLPNKIYAFEIDSKLYRYLTQKFAKDENLQLINEDILKAQLPPHDVVISNFPYSITGAIFEKIFYKDQSPRGALIIESSIAERIFSSKTYKYFSRITVTFNAFMEPVKKHKISPYSFIPIPKIELAFILVRPKKEINPFLLEEKQRNFFLRFVSGVMPYKNKDLVNALSLFLKRENIKIFNKTEISNFIKKVDIANRKISQFEVEEIIELSKSVYSFLYQ